MAAYTKESIAEHISANNNISKGEAKVIVNDIFKYIVAAVADGDEVAVHGFGKFSQKKRAARTGRNPSTGETIEISAKTTLGFKAAKQANDEMTGA